MVSESDTFIPLLASKALRLERHEKNEIEADARSLEVVKIEDHLFEIKVMEVGVIDDKQEPKGDCGHSGSECSSHNVGGNDLEFFVDEGGMGQLGMNTINGKHEDKMGLCLVVENEMVVQLETGQLMENGEQSTPNLFACDIAASGVSNQCHDFQRQQLRLEKTLDDPRDNVSAGDGAQV
ncbi:hypothetical protein VNO78_10558 [Psophocarpus tetragonolobus]|uniref:Uncharacterized protein n=1 Tax=Psophocarpus tetragonolobus TaxID=3891 RepID=A0AAN9SKT5_PSOTE